MCIRDSCASVAPGYAYADVVDIGMSVFVVTNNEMELAEKAAQDLSDLAWSLRESFTEPLPDAKEATQLAMKYVAGGIHPVVIADGADRIGDSTHMLKELLAQGAKNWVIPCITDPKAAKWLEANSKVGDRVSLSIGGWYDQFSGTPAEISGTVEYMGRPAYTPVSYTHLILNSQKQHLSIVGLVLSLFVGYKFLKFPEINAK